MATRVGDKNHPALRHRQPVNATHLPVAVRDAVARAIGQPAYDGEITLRPATAHQSNRLYDVRVQGKHVTAKEYLRADRPSAPRHEYDALRRLEALHLAPEPLFFDPSVGPVVVYRYMEGEMWDRRVPSAAEPRTSSSKRTLAGAGIVVGLAAGTLSIARSRCGARHMSHRALPRRSSCSGT